MHKIILRITVDEMARTQKSKRTKQKGDSFESPSETNNEQTSSY